MPSSSRTSGSTANTLFSRREAAELRQEVQEARLVSSDGSPVTTESGVQVTTGAGLERVSDHLADIVERSIQDSLRPEPGDARLPGLEPLPGSEPADEAAARASVSDDAPFTSRGASAEERAEIRAMTDRLAAAVFDRSEPSSEARVLAQSAQDISAVMGLEKQAYLLSAGASAYTEGDAASNQLMLGMLQEARALQVSVPENASDTLAQAAHEIRSALVSFPELGPVLDAREATQFAADPAHQNQEGRESAAVLLRSAAEGLEDGGPQAVQARDALLELASALDAGKTGPDLQGVMKAADDATADLVNETARQAAQPLQDAKLGDSIRGLSGEAEQSYGRFEGALERLDPDDATGQTLQLLQGLRAQFDNGQSDLDSLSSSKSDLDSGSGSSQGTQDRGIEGGSSERSATEGLRVLLGDDAKGLSDAQLEAAFPPGFAERVQELGITESDVTRALEELRENAGELGREPSDIDRAMALEALVERENAFDRDAQASERTDPSRDGPQDEGLARRESAERAEAAEAQAEMSMAD